MIVSKKTVTIVHRWLAFVLGVFVVFQVTSGSIAQEARLLMRWFTPQLYKVEPDRPAASPAEIYRTMKQLEPEFNIAHVMVSPPNREETAFILMGGRNPENLHESGLVVDYDQYKREVIDEHPLISSGWVGALVVLHRWVLFGKTGFYVVTVLGLATILMSISGIYLYYKTRRSAKQLPPINRAHRSLGIVASFFLISTSFSGIMMSYVHWQDRKDNLSVFANMMKSEHSDEDHMSMSMGYVDPDEALETAQAALPEGYFLSAYSYAGHHSPNYWFAFYDDRRFRQDVVIDGSSGNIVGTYAAGKTEKGDGFRNYLLPFHSGRYFGALGGFLMTFFGFIVVFWLITGFIIYFKKRKPVTL